MNNCLAKLEKFSKTWQLQLNLSKCKVIVFNYSGKILNGMKFMFNGITLEVVQSYCYLGIDFICSGSFRTARSNLVEKARKALAPISSLVGQFNIPSDKALYLCNAMIRPIVMYNSENLAHLTEHQIDTINGNRNSLLLYADKAYPNSPQQNSQILKFLKILKFILGVKKNCSNMATLREIGEIPTIFHGFVSLLSFWHRTRSMDDDTLVKQALNAMTNDNNVKSEWLASVKFLLQYLEMDDYYVRTQLMTTTKRFTHACKKKFQSKFIEEYRRMA